MQLEIVTPEKIIYTGEVDEVVVNTADGEIAVLPHHVNLVTKVLPGELILKTGSKTQHMAITGGFLEVSNNKITMLADYAVQAEEIQINKALEAQKRAEEILKKKDSGLTAQDLANAQAELTKAILELKVARRSHRGGNLPPQN
ncbi:MAG TPA: ATP synthase F1 subunit epsilon [Patescibacteria group bacterium]|nr:ATP synthase F1 subunit epsilon [Patescibacteria group bacterium]